MARKFGLQSAGAMCHVLNRSDRREVIACLRLVQLYTGRTTDCGRR